MTMSSSGPGYSSSGSGYSSQITYGWVSSGQSSSPSLMATGAVGPWEPNPDYVTPAEPADEEAAHAAKP